MKLLFLLLFLSLSGNDPSDIGISYRALTWSDFRAPVPENLSSWVAAMSFVTLDLETVQVDGKFTYAVKTYFTPDSSYVRVKTAEILRHEQTHFQIAYIASLRCMRDLAPFQGGDARMAKKAEKIYDHYCAERGITNDQFDQQTNHSRNKEAERRWEFKISEQLNTLVQ